MPSEASRMDPKEAVEVLRGLRKDGRLHATQCNAIDAVLAALEKAQRDLRFLRSIRADRLRVEKAEAENAALRAEVQLRHPPDCEAVAWLEVKKLRAEVERLKEMYDKLWNSDACEDVRKAEARVAALVGALDKIEKRIRLWPVGTDFMPDAVLRLIREEKAQ